MKDQEFYHIIEKQLIGDITSEERSRLEAWLLHSTENRELFERMEATWKLTGKLKPKVEIDTESALNKFHNNIEEENNAPEIKLNIYRWAAVIALIIAAGFIFFKLNQGPEMLEFQTMESTSSLTLADGSVVTLNKYSTLRYPEAFEGKERRMELMGEGYFEVERDENQPFIVELNTTEVKVLGTSFNIQAYEETTQTEVTVSSGRVGFYKRNDPDAMLVLNKGDYGILNKERNILLKEVNTNPNFLSWNTNELEFNDTRLEEVFNTIEKYFNLTIKLNNPNIANCTFTGTFKDPSLDEMLEVIGLSLNLNFNKNQTTIEVAGEGCDYD